MHKDLVIIGSGPGGYEVAIKAATSGLDVALIEKEKIGGTCLNHGCIPTKALYKNAEVLHSIRHAEDYGLNNLSYDFDFSKVQERKDSVVKQLQRNIETMLKKSGVEVIKGVASFIDEYTIKVSDLEISADYFIIATGSSEKIIPIEGNQLDGVLTSSEILDIDKVPEKLTIIGGGVIGIEMATIFNEFGSDVTIYEYFDHLIPLIDKDITSRLKVYLKKLGIKVTLNALVEKIEEKDNQLVVSGKTKKDKPFETEADIVLMATGRKAFYDHLNLDEISVMYDKNGIVVNDNFQTSVDHIYAVGDVTGRSMLAHVATNQSYKALVHILHKESGTNFDVVPACVFTFPEVATVGLTEDEAKEKYGNISVSKCMFRGNGKALAMGETDGFVKVIGHNDQLLGAHIIGVQASTLIEEAAVIIEQKTSIHKAVNIIHPHPTLTEVMLEALRGLIED